MLQDTSTRDNDETSESSPDSMSSNHGQDSSMPEVYISPDKYENRVLNSLMDISAESAPPLIKDGELKFNSSGAIVPLLEEGVQTPMELANDEVMTYNTSEKKVFVQEVDEGL